VVAAGYNIRAARKNIIGGHRQYAVPDSGIFAVYNRHVYIIFSFKFR
jgi:hypothetical protein